MTHMAFESLDFWRVWLLRCCNRGWTWPGDYRSYDHPQWGTMGDV